MLSEICNTPRNCPFGDQILIRTDNPSELQSAINRHMEARNIRGLTQSAKPEFQVNRVAFKETQVLGIIHSDALNVTSDIFHSAHMVMPLTGGVSQRGSNGSFSVTPGEGLIISPGQQMDMQWRPETIAMTMRVPENTLQRYLIDYFDASLYNSIGFEGKFNWQQSESRILREMLSGICKELQNPDSLFTRGISTRAVEEQLILTFIDTLPSNFSEALKFGRENHKPVHVKKAIEYIKSNANGEIRMLDLVNATGVSIRTLQSGFKQFCSISPMAWIRNYKLRCIREALMNPDNDDLTIGDIAGLWGFYHSSNFARNYLALFGEHPSATRKRRLH